MFQKITALKRMFLEKSLWYTSILIKLLSCSAQPATLPKNGVTVRSFSQKALKTLIYLQKKPPWRMLLFSQVVGLEFIPTIL